MFWCCFNGSPPNIGISLFLFFVLQLLVDGTLYESIPSETVDDLLPRAVLCLLSVFHFAILSAISVIQLKISFPFAQLLFLFFHVFLLSLF